MASRLSVLFSSLPLPLPLPLSLSELAVRQEETKCELSRVVAAAEERVATTAGRARWSDAAAAVRGRRCRAREEIMMVKVKSYDDGEEVSKPQRKKESDDDGEKVSKQQPKKERYRR